MSRGTYETGPFLWYNSIYMSNRPDVYTGPRVVTEPLTIREAVEERRRRERIPVMKRGGQLLESLPPEIYEQVLRTRLDWLELAREAARYTGVRLSVLGIPGDTVTVEEHIDLERYRRVTRQEVVGRNAVILLVRARSGEHFEEFRGAYAFEVDVGLDTNRISAVPPESPQGFGFSPGRILRHLTAPRRGNQLA